MAGTWRKLSGAVAVFAVVVASIVSWSTALDADTLGNLRVTPTDVQPGQVVQVEGDTHPAACGLTPLASIGIYWDATTSLATVTEITPDGSFATEIRIPDDASAGEHVLSTRCETSAATTDLASAPIVVRDTTPAAPSVTPPPTPPAPSGGDTAPAADTAPAPAAMPATATGASSGSGAPAPGSPAARPPAATAAGDAPRAPTLGTATATPVAGQHADEQALIEAAAVAGARGQSARDADGSEDATSGRRSRPITSTALRTPEDVLRDRRGLALTTIFGAVLLVVAFVSAEMANAALAERYEKVAALRVARSVEAAIRSLLDRLPQQVEFVAFTLASVVLYMFLDPELGWTTTSLLAGIGLLASVAITTAMFTIPGYIAARRHGITSRFCAFPAALGFGALCVVVSRLGHFLPGFMVGAIGDFDPEDEMPDRTDGQAVAIGAGGLLGIALLAWFGWSFVADGAAAEGASFALLTVDAILATTVFVALEWIVFGLLPLRFCDGARICAWSRAVWALIYLPALVLFVELLWPEYGTLPPHVLVPVGIASAAGVALWLYVRSHSDDDDEDGEGEGAEENGPVIDLTDRELVLR